LARPLAALEAKALILAVALLAITLLTAEAALIRAETALAVATLATVAAAGIALWITGGEAGVTLFAELAALVIAALAVVRLVPALAPLAALSVAAAAAEVRRVLAVGGSLVQRAITALAALRSMAAEIAVTSSGAS